MQRPLQPGGEILRCHPSNETPRAVVDWRRLELEQCGFPPKLAARVARDEGYDLHQLIQLVHEGCSPALAVRMLSPLEGGSSPRASRLA